MDERDMRYDGRNPYGSRGGYVVSSRGRGRRSRRGRRGDRGMQDYGYDMRSYDMRMDGHHPQEHGSTYYPIQAMGTFEGYYGMPEQDYARGGNRQDYGYDMNYDMRGRDMRGQDMRGSMRGGRDYGYPMHYMHDMRGGRDYGYDYGYYGDYGETLTDKELEEWKHKLMSKLDEREKQMFSKEMISQKAKQMGLQMKDFGEKELEVATLMCYTDYKKSIGQNPDLAVKLAYDWLCDDDVAVKGAEKLAVYHDEIVEGGKED